MKKYNAPEIKVLSINVQSMIAESVPYVPGIQDDGDFVKNQIDFTEDISSDLFGGESFGGAEEW